MARMQQGQDGQPQQPPTGGQDQPFSLGQNFDQNPFSSVLSGLGQQSQQPQQAPVPQQQMPTDQQPQQEDNQLEKGKISGTSQYLLSALQSLHKFITESTDPREITMGRSIISLMSKMIDMDQKKQIDKMNEQKAAMGQTY